MITGPARCGKSTLLKQYQELLRENGVLEEQIISINFEEMEYEHLLDYKALYAYLKDRLCEGRMTYIFLDEIQKVVSYEKVVDSLFVKDNTDIYITGSNAYMLSGDLATLLTGRYIELPMLPLSLKEYCEATSLQPDAAFAEYQKNGGLPYIANDGEDSRRKWIPIWKASTIRLSSRTLRTDSGEKSAIQTSGRLQISPCSKPLPAILPALWKSHLDQKRSGLPHIQWPESISEHGERLHGGACRVIHFLSRRAV